MMDYIISKLLEGPKFSNNFTVEQKAVIRRLKRSGFPINVYKHASKGRGKREIKNSITIIWLDGYEVEAIYNLHKYLNLNTYQWRNIVIPMIGTTIPSKIVTGQESNEVLAWIQQNVSDQRYIKLKDLLELEV